MSTTKLARSFNPRRYTVNADRARLFAAVYDFTPNHWDDAGLPQGAQIGDHTHLALWWDPHTPPL